MRANQPHSLQPAADLVGARRRRVLRRLRARHESRVVDGVQGAAIVSPALRQSSRCARERALRSDALSPLTRRAPLAPWRRRLAAAPPVARRLAARLRRRRRAPPPPSRSATETL